MTIPAFLTDPEEAVAWAIANVDIDVGDAKTLDDLYDLLDADDEDSIWQQADAERLIGAADYSSFAQEAFRAGLVTIYREVRVTSVEKVRFDRLGKYWSRYPEGAGVQGQVYDPEATTNVVLTGQIEPENIDWEHGLISFCYYGEDQWEVAAMADAPILVTHTDGQKLEPPVLGNVGPFESDVGWRPNPGLPLPPGFLEGSAYKTLLYKGTNLPIRPGHSLDPSQGAEFGIYLTPNSRYARQYGHNLIRAWVSLKRPLIVEGKYEISPKDLTWEDVAYLKNLDYDGIVVTSSTLPKASEVVLFDSGQVWVLEKI